MNDWNDLTGFRRALDAHAARREAERKAFSDQLEAIKPVLFVPESDGLEGHGVGWFKVDDGFVAYRRMSNGYQAHRCDSLTFDLVKALAAAI
jgi:hypothetical protein